MPRMTSRIAGIQIEPTVLDVGIRPTDEQWRVERNDAGIAQLVERFGAARPTTIVLSQDDAALRDALGQAGFRRVDVAAREGHLRLFARTTSARGGLLIARLAEGPSMRAAHFCSEDGSTLAWMLEQPYEGDAAIQLYWCRWCRMGPAYLVTPGEVHEAAILRSGPDSDEITVSESNEAVIPAEMLCQIVSDIEVTSSGDWQPRGEASAADRPA